MFDLGSWLVTLLIDAGRKKVTKAVFGSDAERALRVAATKAIELTAHQLYPDDERQATRLALVIDQVFDKPVPDSPFDAHTTILEALQSTVGEQLAVLDDATLTGQDQSSADLLGVSGRELAEILVRHLIREIITRASRSSAALAPLVSQLNHDATHLRLLQIPQEIREILATTQDIPRHSDKPAPEQIDGSGPTVRAALAGLPPAPFEFAGRRHDLAKLTEAVVGTSHSDSVISVITGMGGVGKTSLALKAAHATVAAGTFPGGALFLDLQGYSANPLSTPDALAILLRAIDGTDDRNGESDLQSAQQLYRSLLARRKRTLIVLDNVRSTGQAQSLLPGTDHHRVIITSRHTISDLGARLIELDMLGSHEATGLITSILRSARTNDTRTDQDPQATEDLAAMCTRLPLALNIAAALLVADPTQPIAELVDALRDESTRLHELSLGDHRGIHPVFTLSYARLSSTESRLFRLLSLAPGTQIRVDTAVALVDLPQREVRRLLSSLRRAHMLEPGSNRDYVRFHDLVRLFSEDRLRHEEDDRVQAAAISRMANHYLITARHAIRAIVGEDDDLFDEQSQAASWILAEQDNFEPIIRLCGDFADLPGVLADAITAIRAARENRTYIDSP